MGILEFLKFNFYCIGLFLSCSGEMVEDDLIVHVSKKYGYIHEVNGKFSIYKGWVK